MARCLFIVEDSFFIPGRGLVPVPGIQRRGEERFRVGDPLLLKRPDGSCLEWKIGGIEMISCSPPRPKDEVVILLRGLTKDDVPIQTQVWSVESSSS
jgi:hypothetical protein